MNLLLGDPGYHKFIFFSVDVNYSDGYINIVFIELAEWRIYITMKLSYQRLRRYYMKRPVVHILLLALFFFGCETQSRFVLTGVKQSPLAENAEVKVVAWGDPGNYEAIGIADVGQYNLEERIQVAKRIARLHGGDVIMPKGLRDVESIKEDSSEGYLIQSFLILKTKEEMPEVAMVKDVGKIEKKEAVKDDLEKAPEESPKKYTNLPRATFKLLINDYRSLKGELFIGSLYPKRYFKMPRRLRAYAAGGKKLVLVSTRSGKYKIFLFVPESMTEKLQGIIKSQGKLNFVYTPVDVYVTAREKYPVLEFVDEIKE